jgi:hypothetical protein
LIRRSHVRLAVTMPDAATVATVVFVDCHVDSVVTFCDDPLESVAVAVNCVDAPTAGAVPVTLTDVTEGVEDAVGVLGDGEVVDESLPPHAQIRIAKSAALVSAPIHFRICTDLFEPTAVRKCVIESSENRSETGVAHRTWSWRRMSYYGDGNCVAPQQRRQH